MAQIIPGPNSSSKRLFLAPIKGQEGLTKLLGSLWSLFMITDLSSILYISDFIVAPPNQKENADPKTDLAVTGGTAAQSPVARTQSWTMSPPQKCMSVDPEKISKFRLGGTHLSPHPLPTTVQVELASRVLVTL